MAADQPRQILRLPSKHGDPHGAKPDPAVGRRLWDAQSPRDALVAALVVALAFGTIWLVVSLLLDRVHPWLTVLLGLLVGIAVRRAGRGLDWRCPAVAAAVTLLGALAGNVVIAAAFTATELGTSMLTVLARTSEFTWPVFFTEVMTAADAIYAVSAAALAAFLANRRLDRRQYAALRVWREGAWERSREAS